MESQQNIFEKVEELFFKFGIKSITMDDISREMGISKKTLYQFVENKADLIEKTVLQFIETEKVEIKSVHKAANDPIEELLLIAKLGLRHVRKLRPTTVYDLKKYYRDSWSLIETFHHSYFYECIKTNLEEGIKKGVYRKDVNPEVIAKIYGLASFSLVDENIFPLKDFNKESLFHQYIFYHIHGIASEKGIQLLNKHLSNGNI